MPLDINHTKILLVEEVSNPVAISFGREETSQVVDEVNVVSETTGSDFEERIPETGVV